MARRILSNEELNEREDEVSRMERQRQLELREAKAEGKRYAPGMDFAQMNAQDNAEKRAELDSDAQWKYRTLGGMMSPGERARAREAAVGVTDRQRFDADNKYRNRELDTRVREAELKAAGMRGQGAEAAGLTAEATKQKSANELELGKYTIDRQKEIAAAQNQTNIKISQDRADADVEISENKNKGIGIQGEWNVKQEQERTRGQEAAAAAQARIIGLKQSEKIAQITAGLQKTKQYRKMKPEDLRAMAEKMYAQGRFNE